MRLLTTFLLLVVGPLACRSADQFAPLTTKELSVAGSVINSASLERLEMAPGSGFVVVEPLTFAGYKAEDLRHLRYAENEYPDLVAIAQANLETKSLRNLPQPQPWVRLRLKPIEEYADEPGFAGVIQVSSPAFLLDGAAVIDVRLRHGPLNGIEYRVWLRHTSTGWVEIHRQMLSIS